MITQKSKLKNQNFKTILGIETSCDETAASVGVKTEKGVTILSNTVASSQDLQSKYGGIIPEQAAREQQKVIIPVISEALRQAQCKLSGIDAIAITIGPGLIGSLLVGVETTKTLGLVWNKPIIPINHLIGHFYANWIISNHLPGVKARLEGVPKFPCIGLLVSGGHTDLVLLTDHDKYQHLGGTLDDAAGECFDKCARLLGLPYPGGPAISRAAEGGNPEAFKLPRPMINSGDFNFSFSGLKTAVLNIIKKPDYKQQMTNDLAASLQAAIIDVLVKKTILATQKFQVDQIMIAGGVAANQKLRTNLTQTISSMGTRVELFIPDLKLCTDNAAMIVSAAFYQPKIVDPLKLQAIPNLSL